MAVFAGYRRLEAANGSNKGPSQAGMACALIAAISGPIGIVTLTGASHSLANSAPRSDRQARTLPNVERCGSKLFVIGPFEEMALVVEGVVGRGVDVEEALR